MMIIFLVLLVVFLVYVFKQPQHVLPTGQSTRPDALEILRERYARGEIDADEYNIRRRELEKY